MNKRQLKKRLKQMQSLLEEKGVQLLPEKEESGDSYYIDRLQRLQAEFENYRKRTEKEKAAVRDLARKNILLDFLDLCDVLEQASEKHDPNETEEVKAYREGVNLILKQFRDFLEREDVKPIEVEGETFDPNLHEAMMTEEGDEEQTDMVARELRKGYIYKDEVLRPARVSVYK